MSTVGDPQVKEAAVITPDAIDDAAAKRVELEAKIAKSANRVMKHMNADHEDSLVAYVLAFATGVEGTDAENDKEDALLRNVLKGKLTVTSAQLTAVDIDGFLLEVQAVGAKAPESDALVLSNVRVPYDKPIESAKDLHHTAINMHRKAYDKLGIWYKASNGYYQQVFKMIAFVSYKKVKNTAPSTSVVVGITAVAAATAATGYIRLKSRTN